MGIGEEGEFMAGWSINGSVANFTENSESNKVIDRSLSKSDDYVKWGDCDGSLRGLFDQVLMVLLRGVYAKNGSRPIPALLEDGRTVDLFKLFCLVRNRGGYHSVSKDKLWGLVAEKFGFDCTKCASLKLIYYKYLDELDQWLNRITKDRVSANGSYDCGGSLGLLSFELEKRLRNFSADEEEFMMDDGIGYDRVSADAKDGTEVHNVVVKYAVDDGDGLCDSKKFAVKAKESATDEDINSRKRKRDMLGEMLSWIIKVAKNPCHPSIGVIPGSSKSKESGYKDVWSIALSIREARLQKRFTDLNDQQSCFHQRKHKMHPSMYEDDDHLSAEGLRCSERLLSLANNPPCQCCKSASVDKYTKRVVVPAVEDYPVENHVLVGPRFQAEVPMWTGIIAESDPRWLGTRICAPELLENCCEAKFPGKGRPESCNCTFPGSVECYRFHIAESKMKLRHELGLAFYHWKFNRMGEEVSLSWSVEDEKSFRHAIRLSSSSYKGKLPFPEKKTREELVSYYYNVYLINRRSYQNRVTPKDIDSDDDETEFGSVGAAFGYSAVKVRGSEPLICTQNEQVFDLD